MTPTTGKKLTEADDRFASELVACRQLRVAADRLAATDFLLGLMTFSIEP